jgi:hypothetical protein
MPRPTTPEGSGSSGCTFRRPFFRLLSVADSPPFGWANGRRGRELFLLQPCPQPLKNIARAPHPERKALARKRLSSAYAPCHPCTAMLYTDEYQPFIQTTDKEFADRIQIRSHGRVFPSPVCVVTNNSPAARARDGGDLSWLIVTVLIVTGLIVSGLITGLIVTGCRHCAWHAPRGR